MWPVAERKGHEYVYLNTDKFQLPKRYGFVVDEKIKKKGTFVKEDCSAICRTLAISIEEFTIHPHPDSIRFVVEELIAKYPVIVIEEENKISTIVSK